MFVVASSQRKSQSGAATADENDKKTMENGDSDNDDAEHDTSGRRRRPREPPRTAVPVNNLSDRQYCCVWSVEVYEDGYRPDVARTMLATVARHVNPILRERGWRVKRLIECASRSWIGCCTTNGRNDADAASVNIQLNLRRRPDRRCREFRTFSQVLAVMLHEITHTSIGLEDIHPPAFWDLLQEIRVQYRSLLASGEVAAESDAYGCDGTVVVDGKPQRVDDAAMQVDRAQNLGLARALQRSSANMQGTGTALLEDDTSDAANCGTSRRRWRGRRRTKRSRGNPTAGDGRNKQRTQRRNPPLRKGVKMVDLRTREGKQAKEAKESFTPRELAARAALRRLGQAVPVTSDAPEPTDGPSRKRRQSDDEIGSAGDNDSDNDSGSSSSDDDEIAPHTTHCACRACRWDAMLCHPAQSGT